jgi:hypothetical protein
VGPWKIRSEIFIGSSFHDITLQSVDWLSKRAILSMDSFMDGKVEYFLEAPIWTNTESGCSFSKPLVFYQFHKDNRPQAWKNSDLRIQATLPLLCNNHFSSHEHWNGKEQGNQRSLIRVSMELMSSCVQGTHSTTELPVVN